MAAFVGGDPVGVIQRVFDGLPQAFIASAMLQPLRNGFQVLHTRQQVSGRTAEAEVRKLQAELPYGWMRGNAAHLLRIVLFHTGLVPHSAPSQSLNSSVLHPGGVIAHLECLMNRA